MMDDLVALLEILVVGFLVGFHVRDRKSMRRDAKHKARRFLAVTNSPRRSNI
jgi:hypothetical protein